MRKVVVMISRWFFVSAVVLAPTVLGCAGLSFAGRGVNGAMVYSGSAANEKVTHNDVGPKRGEACAWSVLGLVTAGDSSVATAAVRGGINRITAVDNSFANYLGLYASYCVVVSGQ
jgi:hypothetical protein